MSPSTARKIFASAVIFVIDTIGLVLVYCITAGQRGEGDRTFAAGFSVFVVIICFAITSLFVFLATTENVAERGERSMQLHLDIQKQKYERDMKELERRIRAEYAQSDEERQVRQTRNRLITSVVVLSGTLVGFAAHTLRLKRKNNM